MNMQQLSKWYALNQQIINGYHMSKNDYRELIRLNHLVMEVANKIHNDNMLSKHDELNCVNSKPCFDCEFPAV